MCRGVSIDIFPKLKVHLKRGHNLIVWQASLFPTNMEGERNKEPVLMKSIRVQGTLMKSDNLLKARSNTKTSFTVKQTRKHFRSSPRTLAGCNVVV